MEERPVALITVGSLILCSMTCVKYRKEKVFNEDGPLYHATIMAGVTVVEMIV